MAGGTVLGLLVQHGNRHLCRSGGQCAGAALLRPADVDALPWLDDTRCLGAGGGPGNGLRSSNADVANADVRLAAIHQLRIRRRARRGWLRLPASRPRLVRTLSARSATRVAEWPRGNVAAPRRWRRVFRDAPHSWN